MDRDGRTFPVRRCPANACGLDHGEMTFHRNHARPYWIALCPEQADPLAIVADTRLTETVIAVESPAKRGLS